MKISAKKLPKNDGANNQGAGAGRRLNENENNRQTNNCCKWCLFVGKFTKKQNESKSKLN